jgi:two-component system, response regulator RegA
MPQASRSRPNLLLVDDDTTFCAVLARALDNRGYEVSVAHDGASAAAHIEQRVPQFAVIDLRLPDMSGLRLVARLKNAGQHTRIVVLTGYGSIGTAIDAIKLGATYYLTKPANADEILAAFEQMGPQDGAEPEHHKPVSLNRLEWEHIQRVLVEADGNISAAARALNMHRRTLQRKLGKNPPRT